MFVQNDSSVFYQERKLENGQEQTADECCETLRASFNEDVSCEEVIDAFKSSVGLKAC